jgi:hypothetical protein
MASFNGQECWFRAIFDEEAEEFAHPRLCHLYELSETVRAEQWERHRHWEEVVGGSSCFHGGSPDPSLKPGWRNFPERYPLDVARREVPGGRELGEFSPPTSRDALRAD